MNYLLISTDDAQTILRNLTSDDPDTTRIAAPVAGEVNP